MKLTLRRLRDARGLTLREVARRTNIDINRLMSIENYLEIPSFTETIRLLKTYDCNFHEIFYLIFSDIDDHINYRKDL